MKKREEKNRANNEPKRAINEMQTETRKEKKKSTHVADSVTVSMSGVSPFLLYQRQFYTAVIQT